MSINDNLVFCYITTKPSPQESFYRSHTSCSLNISIETLNSLINVTHLRSTATIIFVLLFRSFIDFIHSINLVHRANNYITPTQLPFHIHTLLTTFFMTNFALCKTSSQWNFSLHKTSKNDLAVKFSKNYQLFISLFSRISCSKSACGYFCNTCDALQM